MQGKLFSLFGFFLLVLASTPSISQEDWIGDTEPVYSEFYLGASDADSSAFGASVYVPLNRHGGFLSQGEVSLGVALQELDDSDARKWFVGYSSDRLRDIYVKTKFLNFNQDDILEESVFTIDAYRNVHDWVLSLGLSVQDVEINPDIEESRFSACLRELAEYSNTSFGLSLGVQYSVRAWTFSADLANNDITNTFDDFEPRDFSTCFERRFENADSDNQQRFRPRSTETFVEDSQRFNGSRTGSFSSQFSENEALLEVRWDAERVGLSVGTLYLEEILSGDERSYYFAGAKYFFSKQWNAGLSASYDESEETTYGELSLGFSW